MIHLNVDVLEQKIELLKYIAKNYKSLEITWEKIADSLDSLSVHDLAQDIRTKFCHSGIKMHVSCFIRAHNMKYHVMQRLRLVMVHQTKTIIINQVMFCVW